MDQDANNPVAIPTPYISNTGMNNEIVADVDHVTVAQDILAMRERRTTLFPSELFDEYAWTMLLHLFIETTRQSRPTTEQLCEIAGTSAFIGQRWIKHLVTDHHMLVDKDTDVVSLTDDALDRMTTFLTVEGLKQGRPHPNP